MAKIVQNVNLIVLNFSLFWRKKIAQSATMFSAEFGNFSEENNGRIRNDRLTKDPDERKRERESQSYVRTGFSSFLRPGYTSKVVDGRDLFPNANENVQLWKKCVYFTFLQGQNIILQISLGPKFFTLRKKGSFTEENPHLYRVVLTGFDQFLWLPVELYQDLVWWTTGFLISSFSPPDSILQTAEKQAP